MKLQCSDFYDHARHNNIFAHLRLSQDKPKSDASQPASVGHVSSGRPAAPTTDSNKLQPAAEAEAKAEGKSGALPLGRDHPLTISRNFIPPTSSDASGQAQDGLVYFPCSLSEEEKLGHFLEAEHPLVVPAGGTGRGATYSKLKAGRLEKEKRSVSSERCMISCEAEGVEDREGVGGEGGPEEQCARGMRACELYQECTHAVLYSSPPPSRTNAQQQQQQKQEEEGSPQDMWKNLDQFFPEKLHQLERSQRPKFAVLMHRARQDASLETVHAAASAVDLGGVADAQIQAGGFTLKEQPRTYYVVSFGGSGSKMLGGWLSERGKHLVKEVRKSRGALGSRGRRG